MKKKIFVLGGLDFKVRNPEGDLSKNENYICKFNLNSIIVSLYSDFPI